MSNHFSNISSSSAAKSQFKGVNEDINEDVIDDLDEDNVESVHENDHEDPPMLDHSDDEEEVNIPKAENQVPTQPVTYTNKPQVTSTGRAEYIVMLECQSVTVIVLVLSQGKHPSVKRIPM